MSVSKESSRRSPQWDFDVLHHGSSGNSSNNSAYSRDSERSRDHDDGELDGHSVYHDVLADALHGARITIGERGRQPERSMMHGDLERSSLGRGAIKTTREPPLGVAEGEHHSRP
ncbi:unnamed protein product [Ectocarpus sp. 12 AP-2014]